MCRSGSLRLPGFPEFEAVVNDLKTNGNEVAVPDFQVCIPVPNGLAIKQNLVDYWTSCDLFHVDMSDLLKKHNEKYNPHGVKRGADVQECSLSVMPVSLGGVLVTHYLIIFIFFLIIEYVWIILLSPCKPKEYIFTSPSKRWRSRSPSWSQEASHWWQRHSQWPWGKDPEQVPRLETVF